MISIVICMLHQLCIFIIYLILSDNQDSPLSREEVENNWAQMGLVQRWGGLDHFPFGLMGFCSFG